MADTPVLVEQLAEQSIVSISACGDQSAAVTTEGKFLKWGARGNFEESVWEPSEELAIKGKYKFQYIFLGEAHVAGLLEGGKILMWGGNENGALGSPNIPLGSYRTIPTEVNLNKESVVEFSTHAWSSAAITKGKYIYYWGKNWAPTTKQKVFDKPQKFQLPVKPIQLSVGDGFVVVLGEDGEIYVLGDGKCGQLGVDVQDANEFVKLPSLSEQGTPNASRKGSPVENKKVDNKKKSTLTRKLSKKDEKTEQVNYRIRTGKKRAAVLVNSELFVWGTFCAKADNGKETIVKTPTKLSQLAKLEIEDVCVGEEELILSVGLESLQSIQFSSFNPPVVKCGTFEGLTEYLLHPKKSDEFIFAYLYCYENWTTGIKLLDFLQQHYSKSSTSGQNAILIVEKWLKTRSAIYDPFTDRTLWNAIESFNRSISSSTMKSKLHKLLIQEFSREVQYPSPIAPLDLPETIFTFSSRTVAEQIMLVDHFFFSKISPTELIGQKWSKSCWRR